MAITVPKEMWQTLGGKKTVKEAREAVKTMRLGSDRVKDVNAQRLSKEFENLQFKEGEMIDDFGIILPPFSLSLVWLFVEFRVRNEEVAYAGRTCCKVKDWIQ